MSFMRVLIVLDQASIVSACKLIIEYLRSHNEPANIPSDFYPIIFLSGIGRYTALYMVHFCTQAISLGLKRPQKNTFCYT